MCFTRFAWEKDMTGVGEPQRITPAGLDPSFPTWMPNSREILFSARGSLWRLPVPGGNDPLAHTFRR